MLELDEILAQAAREVGTGFPENGEDLSHLADQGERTAHTVFALPLMDSKLTCLILQTALPSFWSSPASARFRPRKII